MEGLTIQGMQTVNAFLDAGVTLSTVNLMTMDFNVASTSITQSTLIKSSLNAAHAQYKTFACTVAANSSATIRSGNLLGATVLIGQNDTKNEYFTLDNARDINTFALETSLGHLSMWSLNRDQQCGENYTNTNTLKTFCSGMKQTGGEFATTLRIRIPRHTGHARRFRQRKLEFLAGRPTPHGSQTYCTSKAPR